MDVYLHNAVLSGLRGLLAVELLFFEPYGESQFEATLQFARKWGLDKNIRNESYENLIAPVSV